MKEDETESTYVYVHVPFLVGRLHCMLQYVQQYPQLRVFYCTYILYHDCHYYCYYYCCTSIHHPIYIDPYICDNGGLEHDDDKRMNVWNAKNTTIISSATDMFAS